MRFKKLLCAGLSALCLLNSIPAKAQSEDECAIWLCLPAGFPSGCAGAYSAFINRIREGRPPLPNLASCVTGPDQQTVYGHYEMGRERYEPCEEGFELKDQSPLDFYWAQCVETGCTNLGYYYEWEQGQQCEHYDAVYRSKPRFIKVWVDEQYLGQFFY